MADTQNEVTQEPKQAGSIVTGETLAAFNADKLGLADRAPSEAEQSEPEVEAEQSEPEAEVADSTDEKKQNPKLERRFSTLSKARDQAKAEAQQEREARQTLEARVRELESGSKPEVKSTAITEPKPEQFTDAFEYAKALAEYSAEAALANRDKQDAEKRAAAEQTKLIKGWETRLKATKAEIPDFAEMVESSTVTVNDTVRDAILESDIGPRILYHLAENEEFALKLNEMPLITAIREIGKLEARLEKSAESAQSVTRSKAPAPISPIRGAASGSDFKVDSKGEFHGSYQNWKAARQAGKIR